MPLKDKLNSKWLSPIFGFAITLSCLVVFFHQINLADLIGALKHFKWPLLIPGIIFLSAGYALRILRWSYILRSAGAAVRWNTCVAPFLGSIALNNVLPLRIGDIVRAFIFPASMRISRSVSTTSLVIERLIDLITLLVCLTAAIIAVKGINLPINLSHSAMTLAVTGGLLVIFVLLFSDALSRIIFNFSNSHQHVFNGKLSFCLNALGQLSANFNMMSRPKKLATFLAMSIFIWMGEAGLFYFVLLGMGMEAYFGLAVLIMALATLSTLIPSSPGYVGPFHVAAFTAISMVGGTAAQAGSYAVIAHLALWLPSTLAGTIAIWSRPDFLRNIKRASAAN